MINLRHASPLLVAFVQATMFSAVVSGGECQPKVEDLGDTDAAVRATARGKIVEWHSATISKLQSLAFAEHPSKNSFGGARHLAIVLLGEFRARSAVRELVAHIEWHIDKSTIPKGKNYGPFYVYPCVNALIQIGGTEPVDHLVGGMGKNCTEEKRLLIAGTLLGVLGEDDAKGVIERQLKQDGGVEFRKNAKIIIEHIDNGDRMWFSGKQGNEQPSGTKENSTPAPITDKEPKNKPSKIPESNK